jgi:hypothetical protein
VPVAAAGADGRQRALHRHGDAAAPERPEALVADDAEAHRRRRLLLLLLAAAVVRGREREHPAPHGHRRARGGRPRAAERRRRRGGEGRPRGRGAAGGGGGGGGRRRGRRPPVQDHLGQDGAEDSGVVLGRQQLLLVPAGAGAVGGGGGRRHGPAVVAPRGRGVLLLLPPGGVVGRGRRERRQGGRGDGVVLGRARLRLPQEGHGARRGDAVVHPEGRRRCRALPGEQLGEHLALSCLLQLESPLLVLAAHGCHGETEVAMQASKQGRRDRQRREEKRRKRRGQVSQTQTGCAAGPRALLCTSKGRSLGYYCTCVIYYTGISSSLVV